MSQHDYVIANDSGASVRADLNSLFQAILSQNSGTSEPHQPLPGPCGLIPQGGAPYSLKVRDAGNNHWLTLGTIDDPGSDKNMVLPQLGAVTGMIAPLLFHRHHPDGTFAMVLQFQELLMLVYLVL